MRIIVFGSRSWPSEYAGYIHQRLAQLPLDAVIVHGACPSGADWWAAQYARARGLRVEAHPANWRELGRAAGPRRNAHVASLGADLAIGFRMPGRSSGTDGMRSECKLREIPVELHGWEWSVDVWDRVAG